MYILIEAADKRNSSTNTQLEESMNLLGLLRGHWWEDAYRSKTQRQLHHWKAYSSTNDISEDCVSEVSCTTCRQLHWRVSSLTMIYCLCNLMGFHMACVAIWGQRNQRSCSSVTIYLNCFAVVIVVVWLRFCFVLFCFVLFYFSFICVHTLATWVQFP